MKILARGLLAGWTGYNIIAMGGSCVIWMETDAYHCVGILIID